MHTKDAHCHDHQVDALLARPRHLRGSDSRGVNLGGRAPLSSRSHRPQILHVHGEIAIIVIAHELVLVSQTLLLLQIALCIAGKTQSPRAALSARELPWMVSMHHKSHITWSPKCCGGRVV